MKIIAIEKELASPDRGDVGPLLQAEALRLWELVQAGLVRETYFRADQHAAVLVLECPGLEHARAALDTLPLVQAGWIAFDLIPLQPYDGFARLFAPLPGESQ